MDFGIRVGAVAERYGALLLVRHDKPDREPYWVLPGGRLEPGETIPECAERELMVDVTVRVKVDEAEEAQLGSDPEVEEGSDATLKEVRWVGFEQLEEMTVLPGFIRDQIIKDRSHGWPASEVYLGSAHG
jgi:8-oxo-dGTP diphosphatase